MPTRESVPVIIDVVGVPYTGELWSGDKWKHVKVYLGVGHEDAMEVFSDDKFEVTEEEIVKILNGEKVSISDLVRCAFNTDWRSRDRLLGWIPMTTVRLMSEIERKLHNESLGRPGKIRWHYTVSGSAEPR